MDVHDIVTPKTGNQAAPIGTHKPSNHHLNITSPAGAWETCRPSPTNPRPTLPHNLTQHTVFFCFWPIRIQIKHRFFTVLTRTSTVYRYGWIYDNFGAWSYESQWSECDGLVTLLSPYSHAPLRIVTLLLVFLLSFIVVRVFVVSVLLLSVTSHLSHASHFTFFLHLSFVILSFVYCSHRFPSLTSFLTPTLVLLSWFLYFYFSSLVLVSSFSRLWFDSVVNSFPPLSSLSYSCLIFIRFILHISSFILPSFLPLSVICFFRNSSPSLSSLTAILILIRCLSARNFFLL